MQARVVLHQADIQRALTRIAHEILEASAPSAVPGTSAPDGSPRDSADLVLLGIPSRGVQLAHRLAELLDGLAPGRARAGALDVTMYRDDLDRQPTRTPQRTELPPDGIDGRTVVLVDDVLYSGRTIRAALNAIGDLGRPAAVRLAVLVDRGHRELPIRADFVGKNLPSSAGERINVRLAELDGEDAVEIS